MIFAIISCIGFVGGAWIQGIGGVLGLIGSSLLICCGPSSSGQGGGIMLAALILYIIGALAEIIGAIVGLIAYLGLAAQYTLMCDYDSSGSIESGGIPSEQDCMNTLLGLTAIFIFPAVIVGFVAGVLQIVGAVMAWKAKKAIEGGGSAIKTNV